MVLGVDLCYTRFMNNELLFKDEVYAIQGAIFEVYKHMGNAWHEEVYQQCLERELADEHRRQILNYLRSTRRKLGLLVNFGSYPRVTIERYAL